MRDIQVGLQTEWQGLDEAFAELEKECAEIVRGVAVEAWNLILQQTPQFYGRAVASWSFSIGTPKFVDRSQAAMNLDTTAKHYKTDLDHGDVFAGRRKGDPDAIYIAQFANVGMDTPYRLGDTVYISNGADHGEGPYAGDLEYGGRLRSVNQPGRMASRAFDKLSVRYEQGVTPSRAALLRTMRIGA